MIESQFDEAASADEQERKRIISELASHPDETLNVAKQILDGPFKSRWLVAVQVIRAIGYPSNASALPQLIGQVSDINSAAWQEAVQTLVDMGKDVVVPHLIQAIWDRGRTNPYWAPAMEDICSMLLSVDRDYAVQCGPTIAYLLGDKQLPANLDRSLFLDVLQKISPDCAVYALPSLIDLVHTQETSELHNQIKKLIASFPNKALEPYKYLLDFK